MGEEEYIKRFADAVRPEEELYDLQKDPAEKNNLAGIPEYEDTRKELYGRMVEIMTKNGDELLLEDTIYSRNAGNPAVQFWVKDASGGWTLDLQQPFIVLP